MIAFLFPGQGSQFVGMGADLVEAYSAAAQVIKQADAALGFALSEVMFAGPAAQLTATEVVQPALVAHSVAVLRILQEHGLRPDVVAGHSLGEYSALVAAGALGFEEAVALVRQRGQLMAEDGERLGGSMAAIIGLSAPEVEEVVSEAAEEEDIVVVANYNCPGQLIVSGTVAAVGRVRQLAKEAGARGSIPLKVSGAFHSPLVEGTARRFSEYLTEAPIGEAAIPIVSNVDAVACTDAEGIVAALQRQISHSVLWEKSIVAMIEMGADIFVEVGPGDVLTRMMRRINPEVAALATSDVSGVQTAIESLS